MKLTNIIFVAILTLTSLSSCTSQSQSVEKKQLTSSKEAVGYKLFSPSLTKGNSNYTGYISSRKKLYDWLVENRAANRELAKFIVSADLNTQKIYLYEYNHTGSGQDTPASRVVQNGKVLTLEIFDANTSPIRTKDLRKSSQYAAIIIDKDKINKVTVVNKMNTTSNR